MGSLSRLIICCISSSRTMKLVAEVSSSISSRELPASNASTMLAAWEVLPLASRVENRRVSRPLGRPEIKREISGIGDLAAVLRPVS